MSAIVHDVPPGLADAREPSDAAPASRQPSGARRRACDAPASPTYGTATSSDSASAVSSSGADCGASLGVSSSS